MYHTGGKVYVYLIYGMYWMLNVVTGQKDRPQAVLIRGISKYNGPGKLTRELMIDRSFYGEDLISSNRIWIENSEDKVDIIKSKRIGIDYAGNPWRDKKWRFMIAE